MCRILANLCVNVIILIIAGNYYIIIAGYIMLAQTAQGGPALYRSNVL